MPIQYDSNGVIIQNLTEILDERETALKPIMGEDFVIDKNTPIGNMELADANSELAIQELIGWLIPNMIDANTATGYFLDCICEKNRIYRLQPQYTTFDLILNGTPNTTLESGDITVADNLEGIYYNLDETVIIGGNGTVKAKFICQFYGDYYPKSGAKFNILTPVNGLENITMDEENLNLSIGRQVETDEELRRRRMNSVQQTSTSTLASIKASLYSLNGVYHVTYFENDTEQTDENGLPMKSFEFIVDGGDNKEIAQTIFDTKPAGTRAFGNTLIQINDSENVPHQVGFTRVKNINIGMIIVVQTNTPQGDTWKNKVRQALKEKFDNTQTIGAPVKNYNYYVTLTQFKEIVDIHRLQFFDADAETPVYFDEYNINKKEIAKLDMNNISITQGIG